MRSAPSSVTSIVTFLARVINPPRAGIFKGRNVSDSLYRAKPVVVGAIQWNQHGDHPKVTPFRRRRRTANHVCLKCGDHLFNHGWLDQKFGNQVVCPGDYIISEAGHEDCPMKPELFKEKFEPLQ